MENPALPAAASEDTPTGRCRHGRHHGFLRGIALGFLGAAAIGFGIGLVMPPAHAGFGPMGHHERGWGPGADHDGPPTPAEFRDHAEFFVAFALHRLGATTEQQDKVLKIVDAAVDKATPVIEKHRANRDALHDVLKAGTIDRAAIEKLRTEEVALADDLSKVLAGAIGDSAEVLTPEQRSQFVEHLDRFRHRG